METFLITLRYAGLVRTMFSGFSLYEGKEMEMLWNDAYVLDYELRGIGFKPHL